MQVNPHLALKNGRCWRSYYILSHRVNILSNWLFDLLTPICAFCPQKRFVLKRETKVSWAAKSLFRLPKQTFLTYLPVLASLLRNWAFSGWDGRLDVFDSCFHGVFNWCLVAEWTPGRKHGIAWWEASGSCAFPTGKRLKKYIGTVQKKQKKKDVVK